jgi:amino acid adenylation domain-containing protein
VAVVQGNTALTYAELNRRANQVAHYLAARGVGAEDCIGIHMRRSPELAVGLLAVLKAGGAYVPLDPEYPQARLQYMLAQSGCVLVLGERAALSPVSPSGGAVELALDADLHDAQFGAARDANLPAAVSGVRPDNLAYVIYTSGSTGHPKGSAVNHRNISRLIHGSYVDYASAGTILCAASPSFDAFTFELWGALLHGGRSVMAGAARGSFAELARVLDLQAVDCAWLTSSLFNQLIVESPEAFGKLKWLLVGGEALSVEHVREGLRRLPGTRLINGYGPTENTTFSCTHAITADDVRSASPIPIGRPIDNTQAYVLDAQGELLPAGVVGELYLGGAGLARGYLGQSARTAERFVPHAFCAIPGERLYRTGDLVRWLPQGRLEFLGRIDAQVKIRGFRIELAEIESALLGHEGVRDAAVVLRDEGIDGKRLVGYVVADAQARGDAAMFMQVLQRRLLEQLPEYMIPAALMVLDQLPLTANGKLDRAALPAPVVTASSPDYLPPQGETEELLAGLWRVLLKCERVGRHDNFFRLGGHSLLATQLASRV